MDELFNGGQSHTLAAFPLRAIYQFLPLDKDKTGGNVAQLLISVPKRRFKHAVDRNRVKRQLREAFRKNKQLLNGLVEAGQSVALAFVWLSESHFPTPHVEKRVVGILRRIQEQANSLHTQ